MSRTTQRGRLLSVRSAVVAYLAVAHGQRVVGLLSLLAALVSSVSCDSQSVSNEIVIDSVTRCTEPRPPEALAPLPLEGRRQEFFSQYPLAQLIYQGGPILASPHFIPIFFGSDPLQHWTEALVQSYGCTSEWRAAVSEYGVGDALYVRTVVFPKFPVTTGVFADWTTWIASAAMSHAFGDLSDEDVLLFLLPPAVRLDGSDCVTRSGAHDTVTTTDNQRVAYAFVDTCFASAGPSDLLELSVAITHELIEAATDPDPLKPAFRGLGPGLVAPSVDIPTSDLDNESADLCDSVSTQMTDYSFLVAHGYSNRLARAGRDPCDSSNTSLALAAVRTSGQEPAPVDLSSGSVLVTVDIFASDPAAAFSLNAFASFTEGSFAEGGESGFELPLLDAVSVLTVHDGDSVPLHLHLSPSAFMLQLAERLASLPTYTQQVVVELCDFSDGGTPCSNSDFPITGLPALGEAEAGLGDVVTHSGQVVAGDQADGGDDGNDENVQPDP
jgi:hypothetical protein